MQNKMRLPSQVAVEKDSNSPFDIVIAYENFETGKQAVRLYDTLVDRLGKECHFSNQMWKFEVLGIPKLREMAANDVMTAEIVIIACRGTELSDDVKAWIELWVGEVRNRPLALVALFDCPPNDAVLTRDTRNYLESVALRGQMEFFVQPDEASPARRLTDPFTFNRSAPTDLALSALAGVVQRDAGSPRWGINE